VDLEALESALRKAAMATGAEVLEELVRAVGVGRRESAVRCRCGAVMKSSGVKAKTIHTLLGEIVFERSRYACPSCPHTRYPGDEELGVVDTSRSPGVQRQVARLGGKETFREVSEDMRELAGVKISRKDAERIAEGVGYDLESKDAVERRRIRLAEPPAPEDAPKTIETLYVQFDGTGVPMVPREVKGRKGKQGDGSAKTREAKLCCVFTQTAFDDAGRPVRDPASTTYTGAIESAGEFGERVSAEALRRGIHNAKRVVVITDGAHWCKTMAQTHFGKALHVIDLYHARQHLAELCKLLFDRDLRRLNAHKDRWWGRLDAGNVEAIVEEARALLPKNPNAGKDARREIEYFDKNKERMRYARFKEHGMFVGSGVIEAGCKTIVGQRLKQSGMHWTVTGANAIIALRCAHLSGRIEDYWEQTAA
jgi:hypothetical protein